VVAIDADAGKPLNASQVELTFFDHSRKLADVSGLRCSPRAPPCTLLAA
jgi:hypothetical protein